jgi:hypothetical protein
MEKMLNKLSPESLQVSTEESISPYFYQVNGNEMTWVYVESSNSANWSTDSNSHKFAQLCGIYSEADAKKYSIPTIEGGYLDSMISDIGTAWDSTGLFVASIGDSAFRASLTSNVKITLPISGGTGDLSGLTSVTLYSAFVEQNDSKTSTQSGPCRVWKVDTLKNESHLLSTEKAGLGYMYDKINNPSIKTNGNYQSGIIHLFTDSITWSGETTGSTWSSGWSGDSRYTFGDSSGKGRFATFNGTTRSKSVGFLSTDSGQITIYNPDLVGAFNTGAAISGDSITGLIFDTADSNMVTKDLDVSTALNITLTLKPDTFIQSQNISKLAAKEAGISCEDVDITEFCLYDNSGSLMAVGLLDEVITKSAKDFTIVQAQVRLDGGERPYIYLDGNRSYYTS